jgi:hypothetical protein
MNMFWWLLDMFWLLRYVLWLADGVLMTVGTFRWKPNRLGSAECITADTKAPTRVCQTSTYHKTSLKNCKIVEKSLTQLRVLLRILSTCHKATDKCQNSSNNEKASLNKCPSCNCTIVQKFWKLVPKPLRYDPQVIEIVSVKERRQVQQWPKDCQHSLTNHYQNDWTATTT